MPAAQSATALQADRHTRKERYNAMRLPSLSATCATPPANRGNSGSHWLAWSPAKDCCCSVTIRLCLPPSYHTHTSAHPSHTPPALCPPQGGAQTRKPEGQEGGTRTAKHTAALWRSICCRRRACGVFSPLHLLLQLWPLAVVDRPRGKPVPLWHALERLMLAKPLPHCCRCCRHR